VDNNYWVVANFKETQQRIDQMTQYFVSRGADLSTAQNQAIASISNIVRREAFVMAFNDCFYFICIALLLSGIAILSKQNSGVRSQNSVGYSVRLADESRGLRPPLNRSRLRL
jgi:hypothetical protein